MGLISGSLRRRLIALVVTLAATASLTVLSAQPAGAQERPLLRLGSTGDAVLVLEQRLTELGYQLDTPDTTFGPDTRTAVITLQTAANIGRDGIVGPITWNALDQGITPPPTPTPAPQPPPTPAPTPKRPLLRLGSTGDAVTVLEQRLTELGYQLDTPDTTFGPDTRTAVITLQTAANIGRDGIVGPITWNALDQGITPPPTPTPTPTPAPQPPPTPAPAPGGQDPASVLRSGASGPEVLALEQRLSALGYWVDDIDGNFGSGTHHAVVALQKAAGLSRDGIVGPNTRAALAAGIRPTARTGAGRVLEVDLTRQLLLVVLDGSVQEIHDTATGRRSGTTPVGTWTTTREIDGYRYAPLGTLYRPKYFYRGVAIHGYTSVPPSPASHGCVRVTYPAMDHLWATGVAPVGTVVEVYR